MALTVSSLTVTFIYESGLSPTLESSYFFSGEAVLMPTCLHSPSTNLVEGIIRYVRDCWRGTRL